MNRQGNVTDPGDLIYGTSSSMNPLWVQLTYSDKTDQSAIYTEFFTILRQLQSIRHKMRTFHLTQSNQQKELREEFRIRASQLSHRIWEGPPWKNTLLPSQCATWAQLQCGERRQHAAKDYCKHIHYFPHDQFRADLIALYETLPKENTYYIIEENKSSEYIAYLLYAYDPSIADRLIYLYSTAKEYEMYEQYIADFIHLFNETEEDEPVHFVLLDDISYSSSQSLNILIKLLHIFHLIALQFVKNPPNTSITRMTLINTYYSRKLQELFDIRFHMAFVYITEKAQAILTGKQRYHPFDSLQTTPIPFELTHHYPNVIPSLRKQVGDERFKDIAAYFGYPSHYGEQESGPDCIVYLDHKIADAVSTLGMPLLTGRTAPGGQNVRNYEKTHANTSLSWQFERMKNNTGRCDSVIPLIPACHTSHPPLNGRTIPHPYPSANQRCPLSWYKYIKPSTNELQIPTIENGYEIIPYNEYYPHLRLRGGARRKRTHMVKRSKRAIRRGKTHKKSGDIK